MKLAPHWKGPYQVMQVMNSGDVPGLTYRIANPLESDERQQVVHYERLRPYTLAVLLPRPGIAPSPSPSPGPSSSSVPCSPGTEFSGPDQDGLSEVARGPCSTGVPATVRSRRGRALRPSGHLDGFVMY